MNLIEGIQAQCTRLREHVIPLYESIGPAGSIGIFLMKASIIKAEKAIASGDVIEMLQAYDDLKGFHE